MGPTAEQMRSMVEAAVKAPSSHNTQPWLFTVRDQELELRADRTRALPVNDPYDRELTISCGAALFNLEVASLAAGFVPMVTILPEPLDFDLLARISFRPSAGNGLRASDLLTAIDDRQTTRDPFDPDVEVPHHRESLAAAIDDHHVTAHFDVDREVLRDLVAEGDRAQFADPHWRRELASWMHPQRHREGLIVPEFIGIATRAVVSLVNIGSSVARTDEDLVLDAPILVVLTTETDDTAAWMETGRALEHLLLVAARASLSAGFLNQPCQIASIRGRLHAFLAGGGFPQLIVRLGRVERPARRAPRRPVDDVLAFTTR